MVVRPFNENLQRNFRDQTGCPGAPKIIDDEIPAQAVILMGANFDSSNALYVRTGTFESPLLSNQKLVTANAQGVATSGVIHTVTTGKTFYMTGYMVSNSGLAGTFAISNLNASIYGYLNALGIISGGGSQGVIATATSGTAIRLTHGFGGSTGHATIWGFEQ